MIPPIKAIRRVLWGNITLNNKIVPVIQRNYPYDKTPCITVDDSGGSKFQQRYITTEKYPLQNTHPQYDKDNPFAKYPQQIIREWYETTINIHIWCDNGDDREKINNQITKVFMEAQSDHYRYCNNYHDGDCGFMDNTCYAEHFLNGRSVKGQCPNPKVYGYENIFTTYNLDRASFHIDQPYNLVDTSKDEPVFRSVFKLHTGYYTDHIIGGLVNTNVTYSDEDTIIL